MIDKRSVVGQSLLGDDSKAPYSRPHAERHIRSMTNGKLEDLRIVINLHFRECPHRHRRNSKRDIPAIIPTLPSYSLKVLDPRQYNIHQLAQKAIHILPFQLRLHRHRCSPLEPEIGDHAFGLVYRRANISDGLENHTRDVQIGGISLCGVADDMVDYYLLQAGDVPECDRAVQ